MKRPYSLCFVMPAYRRYALSEITFTQRKLLCQQLADRGVTADVVVIADDENLQIARDNGFHTVECNNDFLGRKFNEGHEFAAKSKYDFSVPVGSDMFLSPQLFTGLTDNFTITNKYAVVRSNGRGIATMHIDWGVLQIIPTRMYSWPPLSGRPCEERIAKGCDTYTRNHIKRNQQLFKPAVAGGSPYECVSFQSKTQITSFSRLVDATKADVVKGEPRDIVGILNEFYPEHLLREIVRYYVDGTSILA